MWNVLMQCHVKLWRPYFSVQLLYESLESKICDVIKIRLKRRDATRSGKGNQPLNIKTSVGRPILKLGLPNFRLSFYFILLLVASLYFRCIFMTSHMKLSSVSFSIIKWSNSLILNVSESFASGVCLLFDFKKSQLTFIIY